ncbi:MAG: precorrin-6y C5,15-methyltransferase (decarboxylating) subunit CbiE [Prevotella sp.]|nr:precorrin-6y C5,15-methyltransferase (decarboxylating) subunit CbiE [Prevotella sp.]
MDRFIIIGITDSPQPFFSPEVLSIIQDGKVFSGGKRHHGLVASLLPSQAVWIDITIPLDAVFRQYEQYDDTIIVFASGDPLFFGFANTLRRQLPHSSILVYPAFNSLQLLAHRLVMPYHDMHVVSLTGRPWPAFDRALIQREAKIGILTDGRHTPAAIASRMLDYGYDGYTMYVGEHLGNPDEEHITCCSLEEAVLQTFDQPNCLILQSQQVRPPLFGIPDKAFALLDGREKMITKMPIRLLTLQALDLGSRRVLWDIGFCTGSVSIEARLQFPHLQVIAFEIRPECEAIISENARRFGAPGIEVRMGDFCAADLSGVPVPDAVFIGGHGGHLKDIMAKVLRVLSPDGIIVMNSVTDHSRECFEQTCGELGLRQESPLHITLNDYNPITILKCRR